MKLVALGINHRTAPVEIREKLSFAQQEIAHADSLLKEQLSLKEGLILSTCNRVEVYAVDGPSNNDYIGRIKKFLSEYRRVSPSQFEDRLYIYEGKDATRHLFRVASGLDSMVVGEMEILGQVKKAYQDAWAVRSTGKVLNRLFEKAFNTAKKIRTETFITRGAVSVSSVAVRLAVKVLGGLEDKRVLVVGAGKIGGQLIQYLKKNGVKSILVANRTFEKARELAAGWQAHPVRFEDLSSALIEADIAITSTGAPHYIVKKSDVASLMPKRKQRPLLIVDLAVPRDVEEQVNKIDNVYLYNIDDLRKIVDENISLRRSELEDCDRIIEDSSRAFMEWLAKEEIKYGA